MEGTSERTKLGNGAGEKLVNKAFVRYVTHDRQVGGRTSDHVSCFDESTLARACEDDIPARGCQRNGGAFPYAWVE